MAENKKSFVLYADLIHTVKKMPKGKRADLFMTILEYVNDLDPKVDDLIVDLVWEPIKLQLKRDLQKYEVYKEKQAENGRLGGRPKGKIKPKITQKTQPFISETQKSLNDTDTVNVNDNVNESVKEKKEISTPLLSKDQLQKSNLFRQPVIPTKDEVLEAFLRAGGTKEMADMFYERSEGTGWFHNSSPIINFRNFVYSYVQNWKKNETKNPKQTDTESLATARNLQDQKANAILNHGRTR